MPSLRTLSNHLGLSITTVSRALDGYPEVAQATRERVHAAALAAGYRPNSAARRLRKGSTEVVTLILPGEPGHFNEPLYIELLAPIGERLAQDGYDLTLIAAPPGPDELKTYRRVVDGRRADALIVVRTRRDDARVAYLDSVDFPFVTMGRTQSAKPYAFVDGDSETAFGQAVVWLRDRGHARIAHLAAPSAFTFSGLRRRGYETAMCAAGLLPHIIEDAANEDGGRRAAGLVLDGRGRPTALLCATDRMAIGALAAARARGIHVPEQLSVIGHDNLPMGAFSDPALTTMELPIAETGRLLAEMVLGRLAGKDPATLSVIRPLNFIERGSTAPVPD